MSNSVPSTRNPAMGGVVPSVPELAEHYGAASRRAARESVLVEVHARLRAGRKQPLPQRSATELETGG